MRVVKWENRGQFTTFCTTFGVVNMQIYTKICHVTDEWIKAGNP